MSTKNAKVLLKKSSVKDRVATAANVEHGELLLNYNNEKPMLEFKDSANAIQVLDIKKCQQASDANPTLSWGTKSKVATVNEVDIHVTMPANPNTTYSAGTGLSLSGTTFNHTNSVTAVTAYQGTAADAGATAGAVDVISGVKYDAQGHVTGVQKKSITLSNTTYNVVAKNVAGLCPALPNETTTTKYLRQDGTWVTPPNDNTDTNTTYTIATGDANGQIKVTPSSGSAYNVDVKGLGTGAYAAAYSLPLAKDNVRGGVKIGYSENGKNYAVKLDDNEKMYVNVPWTNTDTDTTYSAGTGLSLSGTTFSVTNYDKLWKAGCKITNSYSNSDMNGYNEFTWISTSGSLSTPNTSSTLISVDGETGDGYNEINIIEVNNVKYMRAAKK